MFQENERMEYSSTKAPDELKNRTWSSIQQEKRKLAKQRRQGMYLAACFAGVLLVSNVMYQNSTIVKVNNTPVSYLNVSVGAESENLFWTISEGRNKEIQGEIPMEINVSGDAHIEVSAGTIRTEKDRGVFEKEVTEMDIYGQTVIIWSLAGEHNSTSTCTITTENKVYQYVVEKDETDWQLRLKEKFRTKGDF